MKLRAKIYLLILNFQRVETADIVSLFGSDSYEALEQLSDWEIECVGSAWIPGTKPRFVPFDYLTAQDVDDLIDEMLERKKC